jgi:hypothetical protein
MIEHQEACPRVLGSDILIWVHRVSSLLNLSFKFMKGGHGSAGDAGGDEVADKRTVQTPVLLM